MDRASMETSALPPKAPTVGRTSPSRRETVRFDLLIRQITKIYVGRRL